MGLQLAVTRLLWLRPAHGQIGAAAGLRGSEQLLGQILQQTLLSPESLASVKQQEEAHSILRFLCLNGSIDMQTLILATDECPSLVVLSDIC